MIYIAYATIDFVTTAGVITITLSIGAAEKLANMPAFTEDENGNEIPVNKNDYTKDGWIRTFASCIYNQNVIMIKDAGSNSVNCIQVKNIANIIVKLS